jgi:hypothetical protein
MKLGQVELGLYVGYHKMKITEYDDTLQQVVERDLTQEEIDSIDEAEARCNARVVTEIGE